MVTSFQYLGQLILVEDNDWPAVVRIFKVEGGVEEDDKNPHQGGGRATGVRIFL